MLKVGYKKLEIVSLFKVKDISLSQFVKLATILSLESIDKSKVSYYSIPVEFEIKGNFLGYIKFKKSMSDSFKMMNFDKEIISLVKGDSNGSVIATGILTVVGLPNEF